MTVDELLAALENSVLHEGASLKAISDIERKIGSRLPKLYVDLMVRSNGVEGFLSEENYLILWPLEQLAELNEGYGVAQFAPSLWLFGSNGGDAGYAFDTETEGLPVVEVPFIGVSLEEAKPRGGSFADFLKELQGEVGRGSSNRV